MSAERFTDDELLQGGAIDAPSAALADMAKQNQPLRYQGKDAYKDSSGVIRYGSAPKTQRFNDADLGIKTDFGPMPSWSKQENQKQEDKDVVGGLAAAGDFLLGVPAWIGGFVANLGTTAINAGLEAPKEESWLAGRDAAEAFQQGGPLQGWQSAPLGKLVEMLGDRKAYENSPPAQLMQKIGNKIKEAGTWVEEKSGGNIPKESIETLADSIMLGMGPIASRVAQGLRGKGAESTLSKNGTRLADVPPVEGEFIPRGRQDPTMTTPEGQTYNPDSAQLGAPPRQLTGPPKQLTGPEAAPITELAQPILPERLPEAGPDYSQPSKGGPQGPQPERTKPSPESMAKFRENIMGAIDPDLLQKMGLAGAVVAMGGWLYMHPDKAEALGNEALQAAGALKDLSPIAAMFVPIAITHPKVVEALRLDREGVSREGIWKRLGVIKLEDDTWRREISDQNARLNPSLVNIKAGETLPSVLEHQDLYNVHPELLDIRLGYSPKNPLTKGYYNAEHNVIGLAGGQKSAVLSTALHETQHAIQNQNFMSRGGSPEEFLSPLEEQRIRYADEIAPTIKSEIESAVGPIDLDRLREGVRITAKGSQVGKTTWEEMQKLMFHPKFPELLKKLEALVQADEIKGRAYGQYKSLAGEVEARVVQKRRLYSEKERLQKPPWEDFDIPEEQWIHKFNTGPSESTGVWHPDAPKVLDKLAEVIPGKQKGNIDPKLLTSLGLLAGGAIIGGLIADDKIMGALKGALAGLGAAIIHGNIKPAQITNLYKRATTPGPQVRIDGVRKDIEISVKRANRVTWQMQNSIEELAPKVAQRTNITQRLEGQNIPLSPTEMRAAQNAGQFFGGTYVYANGQGVLGNFETNFIRRMYGQEGLDVLRSLQGTGTPVGRAVQTPLALERLAQQAGFQTNLKPLTTDISGLVGLYGDAATRAVANRQYVKAVERTPNPLQPGTQMAMRPGQAPPYYESVQGAGNLQIHPDIVPDMKFMLHSDEPNALIKGMEFVNTTEKRLAVMTSMFHNKALGDAFMGAATIFRSVRKGWIAGSPIDVVKATAQAVLPRVFGEHAMIKQARAGGAGDFVDKALAGGLELSFPRNAPSVEELHAGFYSALEGAQRVLDNTIPNMGKLTAGNLIKANHIFDNITFGRGQTSLKLLLVADKVPQLMKNNPRLTEAEAFERAASFSNFVHGGLNWNRLVMDASNRWSKELVHALLDPSGRRYLRLLAFALDWTISTTGTFVKAFTTIPADIRETGFTGISKGFLKPSTLGDLHRQYVVRSLFWYGILYDAWNYQMSGHHIWENEDPTRLDRGDGTTQQASKHSMEPYHWMTMPVQQFLSKLAFWPKEALNQGFGTEYLYPTKDRRSGDVRMGPKMEGGTDLETRAKHVGKQFLPISVQQAMDAEKHGLSPSSALWGFSGMPIYGTTTEQRAKDAEARKQAAKEKRSR